MSQPEVTTCNNEHFSLFGITCSSNTLIGAFLKKCLDTSITGKLIGMLVVSLLGFAILILFNAIVLHQIAARNHIIRDIAIPQYKVSQYILRNINGFKISLLHTLHSTESRMTIVISWPMNSAWPTSRPWSTPCKMAVRYPMWPKSRARPLMCLPSRNQTTRRSTN